jgi:hypothetical protein
VAFSTVIQLVDLPEEKDENMSPEEREDNGPRQLN